LVWVAQGGAGGSLGWPTGDQQPVSGGVIQSFNRGTLTISAEGVAIALTGAYFSYWSTGSNSLLLGSPVASAVAWSAGGVTGSYQVFEKGMVLSSSTTGTFAVLDGPIRAAWGAQGGSGGSLGWPTGDQQTVSGQLQQQFQRGVVTGGSSPSGEIATYLSTSPNASTLGSATSGVSAWAAGGVSGQLQYFERGLVLSSAVTGTFAVLDGAIRDAWGSRGGSGGSLGWPIADQETVTDGVRQQFQRGAIVIPTSGTPYVM